MTIEEQLVEPRLLVEELRMALERVQVICSTLAYKHRCRVSLVVQDGNFKVVPIEDPNQFMVNVHRMEPL